MKLFDALRSMKQLQSLTLVMLASNVIMAAGLSYAIVQLSNQHERIILVPPSMDKRSEIAWSSANKEYLKSFGLYMATLVGNIQPKSSSTVLDSVGAFMDPQIYNSFRAQLMAVIEDPVFRASGSVISFLPSTIQYEAETGRVFVTGTIITSTAGSQKYSKNVVYEVGASIREGRPWVTHFTSYEGNTPRTVTWWVQQTARDHKPIPEYALPDRWKRDKTVNIPRDEESDFSVMKIEAEEVVLAEEVMPDVLITEKAEAAQEIITEKSEINQEKVEVKESAEKEATEARDESTTKVKE